MFAGSPPTRKIAESISARRISEVSVLPFHSSFLPRPGFDLRSTSIARARPASVMRNARRRFRISSSVFASRSAKKSGASVARTLILFLASSCASPSGKFAGTSADFTPRFFKKYATTFSNAGAFLLVPCTSRSKALNGAISSTCASRLPRSISRSVSTIVRLPFRWRKMNGSPAIKRVA